MTTSVVQLSILVIFKLPGMEAAARCEAPLLWAVA